MLNHAPRLATDSMAFAAARDSAGAPAPFAHCEVFDDLDSARAPWMEMERLALASPYQRYGFVEAWQQTTGRARAIAPMIVVARDAAGRVSAILPLGRSRRGPVWVAEFLGGADANFKMGLFRADIDVGREAIVDLLRRAARMTRPHVDVFWLTNQPVSWQGAANPMAVLPRQLSPSFGHKSALTKDFNGWLRDHHSKEAQKKLRKKTKRLNEIGGVSHVIAQDEARARAILAAFFSQKQAHTRAVGLANPYQEPHTARFFDIAATRDMAEGAQVLELHALMSGERIVATFGGGAQGDRFCGMFISYDADPEISRCSPGQLLILEIIRDLSARGFATFDLGVGEARYKDANCETDEPLFDAAVAVTPVGFAAGAAALLQQRIKRWIKHTPWAWRLADRLRRRAFLLSGRAAQPQRHDL
ncbi:GNAT family N-acetyltransferase [Methylocapsa sp. S129]|uniref:GNAT family N-acetyltransferase n=1 Tax=Methylocapsa sp. S129 TaxID=1641869 RepID=UPI00131B3B61|nr:GNAT family N-acetyltransferase [Methylocapsa sp. S129]